MADGGSAGTQKTVSTTQPFAQQLPYLTGQTAKGMPAGVAGLFPEAARLYAAEGPHFYPGATVAPVTPETNLAWNMAAGRATAGSPLVAGAQGYTSDVLGGRYLDQGNPALQGVWQGIQSRVMPAVASQFSGAGRYGSGAMQDVQTRALTEALAPYMFQTYGQERQIQEAAANRAPGLAAEDYRDIAALSAVGQERQAQQQAQIDAAMQRYGWESQLPYWKLGQYQAVVGNPMGTTTTARQPYYEPGIGSQIAGGLLGTLGLAGQFGWNPFL